MNKGVTIIVALVLFVGAGTAIAYMIVSGFSDPEPVAPPAPDYSAVTSDNEIITLEFVRFKELHAKGLTNGLHPRAKAIADEMPNIRDELAFRNRVTQELRAIFTEQAQGFCDRHPDLWKMLSTKPSENSRDLNTDEDAVLPYCLDPTDQLSRVERCEFWSELKRRDGLESISFGFRPLSESDLEGRTSAADEFLALSKPVAEALSAALKKKRIWAQAHGYDPEWRVELPFPTKWAPVIYKRVQVQLMRGDLEGARATTFQILELSERIQLSRSLLGALFQVVMLQDRFIEQCVTPCAAYGALDADELVDIAERGVSVGLDFGHAMSLEIGSKLLEFLSPSWAASDVIGNKGLPNSMVLGYGKVGIDVWFELAETERPKRIAAFEHELPGMLAGDYSVKTEADFRRCQHLMTTVLAPLILIRKTSNLRDMYVSQLGWVEVRIRAEEVRRRTPLNAWDDALEPFKGLKGIRAIRTADKVELHYDVDYFEELGISATGGAVDDVPFLSYRKWR